MNDIKISITDTNKNYLTDSFGRPRMLGRVIVHQDRSVSNKKVDQYIDLPDSHKDLYLPKNGIFEDDKYVKIRDTANLIVYRGRHMMLCRAFNKQLNWNDTGSEQAVFTDMQDKFISWLGVGTGGVASNNPQDPLAVNATEYALTVHGQCSGDSDKYVTINGRQYHKFDTGYPSFIVDEEVSNNALIHSQLENVTYDSRRRDTYLVAHVQVTLERGEANGTSGEQGINELGLFYSNSDSVLGDFSQYNDNSLHPELFAKTNIKTIPKDNLMRAAFSWFIYF